MSQLIQSLESRTLFAATSVTSAALVADVSQVLTAAATARGDLKSASSTIAANIKTIAADLKSSTTSANRAANARLLNTLKTDERKTFATLRAHETALLATGTSLSKRAASDGKALLLHPTDTRIQARVAADIAALGTVPASLLAKLQADTQNIVLGTDLADIVAANPSNSSLAAEAQTTETNGSAAITSIITAASAFDTHTGTLDAAVSTTPAGSTLPNLLGSFSGSLTEAAGSKHPGQVSTLNFLVATEGTDGSLTGSATIVSPGDTAPNSFTFTGSVTAGGAFTAALTDPTNQNNSGTLTGSVSANTISGTFNSPSQTGAASFGSFTISTAPIGSTLPNLVGSYVGSLTEAAGSKHPGQVSALSLQIATEAADGSVTGSATITSPGSPANSFTISGSVTANGSFTLTVTDPTGQNNGGTLLGALSGTTLSGTFDSPSQSGGDSFGTFTVTVPAA